MRYGADSAMVMKRAALGPAAIAARSSRLAQIRGARLVGGGQGVDTTGAARLIAQGAGGPSMLKGLGDAAPIRAAGAAVAGKVAGTAAAAQFAMYGAWAGPIGMAVGAIVGILAGKLLNKNYLNVAQMNANEDAQIQGFNQYKQIMGQVAGRQLGLEVMEAIWRGANHSGWFGLNNARKCYHNGCSKYPGDEGWIEGAIHGGPGTGAFSFPYAFQQMQTQTAAMVSPAPAAVPNLPPAGPMRQILPVIARGGRAALQGYAGLGAVNGVPEAVILIDNFFIPNNQRDNPPWAVPRNGAEHQLLYDVADAWLAQQPVTTTPYIAAPTTQATVVNSPGGITSADPTQGGTVATTTPANNGPVGGPGGSNVGTTYDVVPVTNPATGQTSYQINPANPTAVSRVAAQPVTAGFMGTGLSPWLLVLMAGLALAVPMTMKEHK